MQFDTGQALAALTKSTMHSEMLGASNKADELSSVFPWHDSISALNIAKLSLVFLSARVQSSELVFDKSSVDESPFY